MGNEHKEIQIPEVTIPQGKQLLEDAYWLQIDPNSLLVEGEGKSLKAKLKGKLGDTDIPTANKRVYPRTVIAREYNRLKEAIAQRTMYGELDHPGDGKTKLARVSHLVTELNLSSNGEQIGVIEFIPGTINGDQALAIARAGGMLGVSSRGFGTTVPDGKGNDVVQEDYQLVTFDLVADPAAANAHPAFVMEQKERDSKNMDLETLKKENPELVEALQSEARDHAREALRAEFEGRLKEEAKTVKEEAVEQAVAKLLKDPEVAGAKTAMDRVKEIVAPFVVSEDENKVVGELKKKLADREQQIARQDGQLAQLKVENEELIDISKELGFHLFLERELKDNERSGQIVEMLGDVTEYESLEELQERVKEISEALSEDDKAVDEYEQRIVALEKENAKLSEERDKALEIGKQFGVRAYVERMVASHPQQALLRRFLNESAPQNKDDVNRLVEAFNASHPVSDEYARIRDGIERHKARSNPKLEFEPSKRNHGEVLGVSMQELVERSNGRR